MSGNEIENDDNGIEGENLDDSFIDVDDKTIISSASLLEMLDKNEYDDFRRVVAVSTTIEDNN